MLRKSYQPAPRDDRSATALAVLLALFILLALAASVVGRVGIDSPERPLPAPVGLAESGVG